MIQIWCIFTVYVIQWNLTSMYKSNLFRYSHFEKVLIILQHHLCMILFIGNDLIIINQWLCYEVGDNLCFYWCHPLLQPSLANRHFRLGYVFSKDVNGWAAGKVDGATNIGKNLSANSLSLTLCVASNSESSLFNAGLLSMECSGKISSLGS